MTDLVLKDALLPDGSRADVALAGGRIARIAAAGTLAATAAAVEDLAGLLLLPGLIEGHIHLDKTLHGAGWRPHRPGGTVPERIEAEKALRRSLDVPVAERAAILLERVVVQGSTNVRCHVDVDDEVGVSGVEALLGLREAWKDRVAIQLVAFPQSGILRQSRVRELLDEALRLGCEAIGGVDPASYDGDVEGQLGVIFDLAAKHGSMVDIHLHDRGELGAFQLRRIAQRSAALGLQGRTGVGHAFALGDLDPAGLALTAAELVRGGVAIMTAVPGPVPMPPVQALTDAGVTVYAGSDNIRDAWSPLGNGDALDRARLAAWRQGFGTDDELRLALALVTGHAARALRLEDYGLRVGAVADLVAVRAEHVPAAVADCPPRALVLKAGRIVARDGALA